MKSFEATITIGLGSITNQSYDCFLICQLIQTFVHGHLETLEEGKKKLNKI